MNATTPEQYFVRLSDKERSIREETVNRLSDADQPVSRALILPQSVVTRPAPRRDRDIANVYRCRSRKRAHLYVLEGFKRALDGKRHQLAFRQVA